jgi:hypothetical protein
VGTVGVEVGSVPVTVGTVAVAVAVGGVPVAVGTVGVIVGVLVGNGVGENVAVGGTVVAVGGSVGRMVGVGCAAMVSAPNVSIAAFIVACASPAEGARPGAHALKTMDRNRTTGTRRRLIRTSQAKPARELP